MLMDVKTLHLAYLVYEIYRAKAGEDVVCKIGLGELYNVLEELWIEQNI